MSITTIKHSKSFEKSSWDLSDLFSSSIDEQIHALQKQAAEFETTKPLLTDSITNLEFLGLVEQYEKIAEQLGIIDSAALLKYSENTSDPEASRLCSIIEQLKAEISNSTLFFDLWLKTGIDDQNFECLKLAAGQVAGQYARFMEQKRRFGRFTQLEDVEKMVNLKDSTGCSVLDRVFDALTAGFRFSTIIDGKRTLVNGSKLRSFMYDPSPVKRKEAYTKLLKKYASFASVLGEMYSATARDWYNEQIKTRGYSSPIGVTNFSNELPDESVAALLNACRENRGVFQRYFMLKPALCGLEGTLSRFDLYAPIKETSNKKISFPDAAKMILENMEGFSPELAGMMLGIFEKKHVHSEDSKNKKGGAYCSSITQNILPYVFINYHETMRDVFMLAHELGHGLHTILSSESNNIFTLNASLPLAETASVFSEMMLIDRLIAESEDPVFKKELLAGQIDNIYATVMRQAYFVMFEKAAHDMINSPKGASTDDLSNVCYSQLREQFGASVTVPKIFRNEWLMVPHIYQSPFYCYAYSFGQLLTMSLYQNYKNQGAQFIPQYVKILKAGSSEPTEQILDKSGIDIKSKEFWQSGFDLVSQKVDELERLM